MLLFLALHAMTAAPWRSGVVAALFAVHPLHVESVAYVAERKDVLSGCFWMLTMLAYARYAKAPSIGRYGLVGCAFALGLAAKSMLVTLPFVLLLLDLWPLGRLAPRAGEGVATTARRLVVEKMPLVGLAVLVSMVTFAAQQGGGSVAPLEDIPLGSRVANALLAYVGYVGKMLWPLHLSCFYPYPQSFDPGAVALAAVALLAASVAALALVRRRPYVAVGWFWYLGTLVPVIGLVQVGEQAMADRYTYLPLIGLFILITWGAYDLLGRFRRGSAALAAAALLVIALCAARTRVEASHWRNSIALFEHALQETAGNHVAHNNLGLALRAAGRKAEAMPHFAAAIAASPRNASAHNHLGLALRDQGRVPEAVASFRESIRLAPDYVAPHFNLGETLLASGDAGEAEAELRETVRLDPTHAGAHLQLGALLRASGRAAEAVALERRAVALRPDSAEAHGYLADSLAEAGRLEEAIAHYREALRLQPGDGDARYNLGNALARRGDLDGAIEQYRRAIALAPGHAEAHNNLGRALAMQGKVDEALAQYDEALRLAPTLAPAYYNRGTAYQRLGQSERAAADIARARELGMRVD